MLPSSHVFSIHGSMVCFRLNILLSPTSVRDFFCFFAPVLLPFAPAASARKVRHKSPS